MRRLAPLCLLAVLSGCGYQTWWNPPFTGGYTPNSPAVDSENMQRVLGQAPPTAPISTEAGDIWPGPLRPPPTLQDLEAHGGITPQPQAPAPGSPLRNSGAAPRPPEGPGIGSSTPPPNEQPGLRETRPAPPLSSYAAPPAQPPADQVGKVVQTPSGPQVTTGGGQNYQTAVQPGGGQSIIVPNGNGTSTIIHSDGRIETVPTPK